MVRVDSSPSRAKTQEMLDPLVELCKLGKLFEVQQWIDAGNPVNPPAKPEKRGRRWSPLEYAIDRGFHSLVKVLLDGGAIPHSSGVYCPMERAIEKRRLDIIELLVAHGYDPKSVDMCDVFESWEPAIMEFFIERGTDVETNNPLAWALCAQIRTALGVLKRYRDRFPSFAEQLNIALRHNCKHGDLKWTNMLLYAGADPLKRGAVSPDEKCDSDWSGLSALAYAALHGHFEIFALKKIRIDPSQAGWQDVATFLCKGEGIELLTRLFEKGLNPNDQENGGSSLIRNCLHDLNWADRLTSHQYDWFDDKNGTDTSRTRELMKVIHLVAKHGGRWLPTHRDDIASARKALTKLTPDYTVEFIWIMAKYQACSRESIRTLLQTPKMKSHTSKHAPRIAKLCEKLKD